MLFFGDVVRIGFFYVARKSKIDNLLMDKSGEKYLISHKSICDNENR